MPELEIISIEVNSEIKEAAESIFESFGLSLTDAMNIFLHKSIMESGLPFDVRQPRYNAATEKAMQEARDIIAGKIDVTEYDSVDAMFAALDRSDDDSSEPTHKVNELALE